MAKNTAGCQDTDSCFIRIVHEERVEKARKDAPDEHIVEKSATLFKLLGDPTRLKITAALVNGEMCVCDLSAYLGVSESAVSHQLRRLRENSLVKNRREGQVLFYSLADDHVKNLLAIAMVHASEPQG